MKSEQALHKRASASVASAKKSLTELIGERAAGLFGPIEAILQSAANEIQDSAPFDREERAKELTDQANDAWAKLMEQRNPKPVVADEETQEGEEFQDSDIDNENSGNSELEDGQTNEPGEPSTEPNATTSEIPVGEL
jgi:cobalamin biosynthesis protein CobT